VPHRLPHSSRVHDLYWRSFESAGGMAVRLLRTFTAQAEALAKLQCGGEQVVRVVHVHPGAQAVIGTVKTSGRGGGTHEIGNQPHAPDNEQAHTPRSIAVEQLAAMPCQDAEREPMPVPLRARKAPLPHARRRAGQRGAER